jgi:hypothetical protein
VSAQASPPAGPDAPGRVDPERQRLVGIVIIVIAVLIGVVLLFRGLSAPDTVTAGDPDAGVTVTTVDRDAPPSTDVAQSIVPAAPDPADVTVVVANGSGVSGLAARVTATLTNAGYVTLAPTDALADASVSRVYYAANSEAAAQLVAQSLELPASAVVPLTSPSPVAAIGTAQVVVVLGADFPAVGE